MYKQHQGILKEQIKGKDDKKNRNKMNTLKLLYNKALMKAKRAHKEDKDLMTFLLLLIDYLYFSTFFVKTSLYILNANTSRKV